LHQKISKHKNPEKSLIDQKKTIKAVKSNDSFFGLCQELFPLFTIQAIFLEQERFPIAIGTSSLYLVQKK
jgi:hypothetical protein